MSLDGRGRTYRVDCLLKIPFRKGSRLSVSLPKVLSKFLWVCASLSDSFADEFLGPSAVGPFVSPSVSPSISPYVYLISYRVKFYHSRISSVSLRCRNFLIFVYCKEI